MISALGEGIMTIADGPEMPSINDFLPDPFVFQGTPFAINRIILVRILATVIMLLVLGITASRAKLIPGRWQGAVEWLIEFVRDNIVYQVMGELRGKRYVPMITTVFCTLLVFNLCGIIPGFNIAASASITLPLVFAMWCFCQYWIAGIREKGLGHFLRDETLYLFMEDLVSEKLTYSMPLVTRSYMIILKHALNTLLQRISTNGSAQNLKEKISS